MATDAARALKEAEQLLARGDARGAEARLAPFAEDAEAVNMRGNALATLGRLEEAEACYRRAMALAPRSHKPIGNLGNLLAQRGLKDAAIALYYEALAIEPAAFRTRTNLGHEMLDLGRVEEAMAAYAGALAQKGDHVPARLGLARALLARGEAAEALSEVDAAAAIAPGRGDVHHARGLCLERLGALEDAAAAHRRAVAAEPGRALYHKNLAIALSALGSLDEAASAASRAADLDPALAAAHLALGTIRVRQARFDEGIAAYRRALDRDPTLAEALSNIGAALQQQGRIPEAVAHLRRALEIAPWQAALFSNLLMAQHYDLAAGPRALAEEHRAFGRRHGGVVGMAKAPRPKKKLRLGFVSADLRDHSVARFVEPIFASFDRKAFEVFAYADVARPDRVSDRLRALVTTWHHVRGLSDDALAALIARDGIDILIDLGGHSGDNRLPVFARQPAPVQVTYLGYPNTTGLPAVGFRLTDAIADPPGTTEDLHVERLVRLPRGAWCYAEPEAPAVSALPAASRGYVTFGCFNDFSKARPEVMALWAEILRRVPGSRLLLKAKSLADPALGREVRAFFARHGVSEDRVEVRGWTRDRAAHLALHEEVDAALDTFPYHGTTTTCDALWMGVPVVTLAGEAHVSRVGASLLDRVGLADLVAASPEAYVDLAVQLAFDLTRLAELRRTLRDRVQASPLGQAEAFTRALEEALRAIWAEACEEASAEDEGEDDEDDEGEPEMPAGAVVMPLPEGARIVVPGSREKITPCVLYEQGDWFEDEIRFVRRLLQPGDAVIDVGANYGVYALSMARAVGPEGLVAALEPASETAGYLDASAWIGDLAQLDVVEAAASNRAGTATLYASPHAELSSLHAVAEAEAEEEEVELVTLDGLAEMWAGRSIRFLKLDAEGEEAAILEGARRTLAAHAPLVMYKLKRGAAADLSLVRAFAELGMRSYRLIPGLLVLAPFDDAVKPDPFQLNLFACGEARARDLEARGLLARAVPRARGFDGARAAWTFAHGGAPPGDRIAALLWARDHCAARGDLASRLSLARLLAELGERRRALDVLAALEDAIEEGGAPSGDFLAPAPALDGASPRGESARFALAAVLAARAKLAHFSCVYGPHDPAPYRRFLDLGYRDPEMARRLEIITHRALLGIAPR